MSKFWASNSDDSESGSGSESDSNSNSYSDDDSTSSWNNSLSDNDNNMIKPQRTQEDIIHDNNEELLFLGDRNSDDEKKKIVFENPLLYFDEHFDNDNDDDEGYDSDNVLSKPNDLSLDPNLAWEQIQSNQIFLEPPTTNNNNANDTTTATTTSSTLQQVLRIVCMSDTHGQHRRIPFVPKGDVLIHGGDFTKSGETGTISDFVEYLKEQQQANDYKHVICISGNHDVTLDLEYYNNPLSSKRHKVPFDPQKTREILPSQGNDDHHHCGITYLEDSSASLLFGTNDSSSSSSSTSKKIHTPLPAYTEQITETENNASSSSSRSKNATTTTDMSVASSNGCIPAKQLEVYGTPWTPAYNDWAFNLKRGEPLRNVYQKIPSSTDILITHGPPLGRGDKPKNSGKSNYHVGCVDLLQQVQTRIQPRIHIYGHVHEGYGVTYDGYTLFVNASNLIRDDHPLMNPCIVIDVPIVDNNNTLSQQQQQSAAAAARVVVPDVAIQNEENFLLWLQQKRLENISMNYNDYCHYDRLIECIEEEMMKKKNTKDGGTQAKNQDMWKRIVTSLSSPQRTTKQRVTGYAFSYETAYYEICDYYHLHRDKSAQEELCYALYQLYAESF